MNISQHLSKLIVSHNPAAQLKFVGKLHQVREKTIVERESSAFWPIASKNIWQALFWEIGVQNNGGFLKFSKSMLIWKIIIKKTAAVQAIYNIWTCRFIKGLIKVSILKWLFMVLVSTDTQSANEDFFPDTLVII